MRIGHGDDAARYTGHTLVCNFSSNVYTHSRNRNLEEHLKARIGTIHTYPEADAGQLRKLLAAKIGIAEENILVTAGATEAIYLIAQAHHGKQSVVVGPTFSEYADASRCNEHSVNYCQSLQETDLTECNLVWLCNPNNPTGRISPNGEILAAAKAHPDRIYIIDESYSSFSPQPPLPPADAIGQKNVLLIHSLTKQYLIPGLRLGFVIGNTALLEKIVRLQPPWTVNALAQAAGIYLLQHPKTDINLSDYLTESRRFQNALAKIDGLNVLPSPMHFFLCQLEKNYSAANLKEWLMAKRGFLIRDASNFWGLDKSYFRLCAQRPEENRKLVNAVAQWISEQ